MASPSTLSFTGFYECDFFSNTANVRVGEVWYTGAPRKLRELLHERGHVQSALRDFSDAEGTFDMVGHPRTDGPKIEYELPLATGIAFGLGPLLDGGNLVTVFDKARHYASADGEPVAVIGGKQCNAELELFLDIMEERCVGFGFALDLGINGQTDDRSKCYKGSASFSGRLFLGAAAFPDAELKLEVKKGWNTVFTETRSLAEYLRDRNPTKLLPLFYASRHYQSLKSPRATAVLMGAAINTGKPKREGQDPVFIVPGMEIAAYVNGVQVLEHKVVEASL